MLEPWVLAGSGTSCLTLPLGSPAVIKARLYTTAGQGQRLAGGKEGILQGKSFSLPSRERQGLLLTMQAPIPPPFHISSLHFPTLPSPSSWKCPTSVGHSILPVHRFPFLCSHLQFLNHPCSCSFPPLASIPPSSVSALFLSRPYPYLQIIYPSSSKAPFYPQIHQHICLLAPSYLAIPLTSFRQ